MAKDKSGDTAVVPDPEGMEYSTGLLSAVSVTEYDRARAWDMYVAGGLAYRNGPNAVQTAVSMADQALAERDKRFSIE